MPLLFSVIIPTYNRASALDRCLNSLVNQTYKNFEVIVCDDGSTDHTQNIVHRYENLLNLKYFYTENWGGPARPRNIGIKGSSADWICFLDSDDWWHPTKIEKCMLYLSEYDVIYHNLDIVNKRGKKAWPPKSRQLSKDALADLLLNGNTIATSSVCIKKNILTHLGGFSEERELIAVEDYDLWLRVANLKYKFKLVKDFLGSYWNGGENISERSIKQIQRIEAVYKRHISFLPDSIKKSGLSMKHYYIAKILYDMGSYKPAAKYFNASFYSNNKEIKFKSLLFKMLSLIKMQFQIISYKNNSHNF